VLLATAVFGAGFCLAGSQVGVNALAAGFYPTANRATGVAWANGVGRIGSVLGSMVGGILLGSGLGLPAMFTLIGIPVVIAGACMLAKGMVAPQPVHRHAAAVPLPATAVALPTGSAALQK
jgi:AAHS family 4-hydroxybenzoate transporter-like MFS transporter